ncbi:hypothetical protein B5F74_05480 [Collinsella sp. An271]|uniref:DUF7601 domain-containing protein n=1 Tax=Collinsella sp. An271 TaxID=1965616 RepID=UPI000B37DE0C|nr:FctA domain-containing protein [Collinsella sp. An271]OUO61571.1 hypothetical protein B5F74_05480 [Collinsella sp. An271]
MHRLARIALLITAALALLIPTAAQAGQSSAIAKIVDPNTSDAWSALFEAGDDGLSFSSEQAGRIWVDKTVYGSTDEANASGVPARLDDEARGFLVSLSALSSAVSVRHENDLAHDVVFVVSTNGMLADMTYGGRPQGAYLADALNVAIARLMAENEGAAVPTRIAVVGYSADVATLMPLDTYTPDSDGRYVSFAPRGAATTPALLVNARADHGSRTTSMQLRSGSYLQRAVRVAGDLLVQAAGDAQAAERKPELVLMGVQTPPMAHVDLADPPSYTGDTTGFLGPLPNTRENGYGTDAMMATLLTVRAQRRRIEDAWKPTGRDLALYTTGLDATATVEYLLQTAEAQQTASLPGSGAATGVDLARNMAQAARAYADAAARGDATVSLDLFGSSASGLVANTVDLPCLPDLLDSADGYALSSVDEFFSAHSASAISWAFNSAINRMLDIEYTSPSPADTAGARWGESRLTVEDRIGAGMNVSSMKGIVYGTHLLDGALAAQAVTISMSDPWDIEATHEYAYLVDTVNERYDLGYDAYNLFFDAFSDGQFAYRGTGDFSNRASWYVDAEHHMVAHGGRPYTFATTAEVDAVRQGDWADAAPADVKSRIEAARDAGATAVCETWFFIGNLPNQYTGGDIALYDVIVMVETDLETGRQTVLASLPTDALPARRASVTVHADGKATMALEDPQGTYPIRLVYEVEPTERVSGLLDRIDAGETVSDDELSEALGERPQHSGGGSRLVYAGSFSLEDGPEHAAAGCTAAAYVAPTNAYYAFTEPTPLFALAPGASADGGDPPQADDLIPLTSLPEAGATYYFMRTVYSASHIDPDGEAEATVEQRIIPYVAIAAAEDGTTPYFTDDDGQVCVAAGTPRFRAAETIGSSDKAPNLTGSAPYVTKLTVQAHEGGQTRLAAQMGNNGALALPSAQGSGDLTVEVHVRAAGSSGDDGQGACRFRITFTTEAGAALAGPVVCTDPVTHDPQITPLDNGSFDLVLADGASATVADLPAGTGYRIEELPAKDGSTWKCSHATTVGAQSPTQATGTVAEGTVVQDQTVVSFTNVPTSGRIEISKSVTGNDGDTARAFPFLVRLAREDGLPLPSSIPYELDGWTRASGIAAVADDGSVTQEDGSPFALADRQRLTLSGIPLGIAYAVEETDPAGHTVHIDKTSSATDEEDASDDSASGLIEHDGQHDVLAFTNERWAYGSLEVAKHTVGGEAGRAFAFTAMLTDAAGAPLQGTVSYRIEGAGEGESRTAELQGGTFFFELADGQTLVADDIPQGTAYRVAEQDYAEEGYLALQSGATGTIGDEPARATFANINATGALGIAEVGAGNAFETDRSFSFAVTLKNLFAAKPAQDTEVVLQSTRYASSQDVVEERLRFERVSGTDDGRAVVENVAHGTGVVIKGLAPSMAFSVEELDARALEDAGYRIYLGSRPDIESGAQQNPYEGTLASGGVTPVFAVNVRDLYGTLAVSNSIEGQAALDDAQAGQRFLYTVHALTATGAPVSGAYAWRAEGAAEPADGSRGTMPDGSPALVFDNGYATFEIAGSGTMQISALPAGGSVTVAQRDEADFGYTTSPALEQTAALDPNGTATLSFTNVKEYEAATASVPASSTLFGRAQQDGEFTYRLFDEQGDPVAVDGEPASASSAASPDGVASALAFPQLTYREPGTYSYSVRQAVPADPEPGVAYDERAFDVRVDVTANSKGALSARVTTSHEGKPMAAAFENRYRTTSESVPIEGTKTLDGKAPAAGAFAFTLQEVDANGEEIGPVLTSYNDEEGGIAFGPFELNAPVGSSVHRTFIVRENIPEDPEQGIVYDTRVYRAELTGESADDGTLDVHAAYSVRDGDAGDGPWLPCSGIVFENRTAHAPETPDTPIDPDTPVSPDTPDTPDSPDEPGSPESPDTPESPDSPDTPDTPDGPSTPESPEEPVAPESPDSPSSPDTPPAPTTPADPETPAGTDAPPEANGPDELAKTSDPVSPLHFILLITGGIVLIACGSLVLIRHRRRSDR